MRILIAEDEQRTRQGLVRVLQAWGMSMRLWHRHLMEKQRWK